MTENEIKLLKLLERCKEFIEDHDAPPPMYRDGVYRIPQRPTEKAQDAVDKMKRECELRREINEATLIDKYCPKHTVYNCKQCGPDY